MTALRESDMTPKMFPSPVLHVMSDEQLDKLILEAVQRGYELGQKKPIEKPLTKQEAADYMRIHVNTLDGYFRDKTLPISLRHYVGGSIYFFASDLEAFIKKS